MHNVGLAKTSNVPLANTYMVTLLAEDGVNTKYQAAFLTQMVCNFFFGPNYY